MDRLYYENPYDVVIMGAGHAGCEAALAAARLGLKTAIMSISSDSVVDLPYNPSIGGTGRGHLVKEVDALGGEMGLVIDKTYIQSRMLNTSKGPVVHSLRVQADKGKYHDEMKSVLENIENLDLIEAEVVDIGVEDNKIKSVAIAQGAIFPIRIVILATGTYPKDLVMMGEYTYESGPHGMKSSKRLSDSLKKLGIELRRFKTGTPARVHRDSLNYEVMTVQPGDDDIIPFSFLNDGKDTSKEQEHRYLTYTTLKIKQIIEDNLERPPMYAGIVKGVGPRYCPSTGDKIMRFPDRDEHQVFVEPEGLGTKEIYTQGVSSTLPERVQREMYEIIIGFENVRSMRSTYGIEYDCTDPTILEEALEHLEINNLFFAGQTNGSSEYEEAAGQGVIAGINATMNLLDKEPSVLDRSDAYIGVLIDDLVTKETNEPYRVMTNRCEYRLTLRQDDADLRLIERAYEIGLATDERYEKMLHKKKTIDEEIGGLKSIMVTPTEEINEKLRNLGSSELKAGIILLDLIKRPESTYDKTEEPDAERPELPRYLRPQVETYVKYEGYIAKQMSQIKQFKKLENRKLDVIEDYREVMGPSNEAVQKLSDIKPESLRQASRTSGVSPSDINVLLIYMETREK